MDVGLMPLPDTDWTRGKCAYKALQYMAGGVPVVADDVGVTARIIGDGAGHAVRGEEEWVESLVVLLTDANLRNQMGSQGRSRVERDFSVNTWTPKLAALLRGG
jgi:glycosyltransferase involved in cell wall biosynthesis